MMNYQSIGRNQRPKGFKVKQALQLTLFLAVCIWLLYQIKNSHDEKKYHGRSVQNKLIKERSATSLGRKGSAGLSKDRVDSDSGDVNPMRETRTKEDGSAGDDEIDRNPIEKAEAESYIKESENVATREGDELQTFEDSTSGIQEVNLNKDIYKDDFSSKGHEQSNEKNPEKLVKDKDEAVKDNDEDRGPMKIAARLGGIVNVTAPGSQSETEGEVRSFHDETGVPQDDSDESTQAESISYTRSRMVEGEDVESKEGSITAYAKKEDKVTSEDSKNDITTDADVGLGSSGELSINHSVSSQQKIEEVNDTSVLRQAE